jgi:hypothetical protein
MKTFDAAVRLKGFIKIPILKRFKLLGEWFVVHNHIRQDLSFDRKGFICSHQETGFKVGYSWHSIPYAIKALKDVLKERGKKKLQKAVRHRKRLNAFVKSGRMPVKYFKSLEYYDQRWVEGCNVKVDSPLDRAGLIG